MILHNYLVELVVAGLKMKDSLVNLGDLVLELLDLNEERLIV